MGPFGIVQLNARTPTFPTGTRFFIDGTPGSGDRFISMRRLRRLGILCFGAISRVADRTGFWKCPFGCLIGRHVPPATALMRRM